MNERCTTLGKAAVWIGTTMLFGTALAGLVGVLENLPHLTLASMGPRLLEGLLAGLTVGGFVAANSVGYAAPTVPHESSPPVFWLLTARAHPKQQGDAAATPCGAVILCIGSVKTSHKLG